MSNKRIAVNIGATYIQNFVSVVVGLFSARWVYLALGEERFGLFSLVGSLIAFVGVFNSLMTNSNARFFAISIGQGRRLGTSQGSEELRGWFNTAISVHLVMGVLLCVIMYPVGICMIRNKLTIPNDLLSSAEWVFRISIVTMFFSIMNIPFNSLYTAKQLIFVRNFSGILQTLLCAAEGWWLLHYSGNRLVGHSAVTSLILLVLYAGMAVGAFVSFEECKIRFDEWFDKRRLKELFSYSSFTLFGSVGGLLSGPGVNIVLNVFFGPSINAVIGIGRQISSKVSILSSAIISAVSPEVMSRVGANDMERANALGIDICYYATAVSLTVFVPVIIWLPELLVLWLKTPPSGLAVVSIIMIVEPFIASMTLGYQMMIHASGKIKLYHSVLGILNMSCVLILWILLKCGFDVFVSLAVAWLVPRILMSLGRVVFAKKILEIRYGMFFRNVLFPVLTLALVSGVICFSMKHILGRTFLSFFFCCLVNAIIVSCVSWWFLRLSIRTKITLQVTALARYLRFRS